MERVEGSLFGRNDLEVSDRFCPVCKNKNDPQAIVCIHCGASLDIYFTDSAATKTTEVQTKIDGKTGALHIDETLIPVNGIAIYVEGTSNPVFKFFGEEFVIGRKVDGGSEVLLDLSPLGGYHLGLSRRHATIRKVERGYEIMDLSSSNGTWLNDQRLVPNKSYLLTSGSQLRLARMRFFVLYRLGTQRKKKK
jgi:hypothetical protein